MKTYTVIGVYDDGQTFCDNVEAEGPHEAMRIAATQAVAGFGTDLEILGAIEGTHDLFSACEDAGRSAYANDLVEDEEVQP